MKNNSETFYFSLQRKTAREKINLPQFRVVIDTLAENLKNDFEYLQKNNSLIYSEGYSLNYLLSIGFNVDSAIDYIIKYVNLLPIHNKFKTQFYEKLKSV